MTPTSTISTIYITILFLSDRFQPLSVKITKCRVHAVAGCSCMWGPGTKALIAGAENYLACLLYIEEGLAPPHGQGRAGLVKGLGIVTIYSKTLPPPRHGWVLQHGTAGLLQTEERTQPLVICKYHNNKHPLHLKHPPSLHHCQARHQRLCMPLILS